MNRDHSVIYETESKYCFLDSFVDKILCQCQRMLKVQHNALISHAGKVMLKILQARLQQYVNLELPIVEVVFKKDRGTRAQIANMHWIIGKEREFHENIYICFTDYIKAVDCVDHKKLWKILQVMGIPDHLTCLLRNLYQIKDS